MAMFDVNSCADIEWLIMGFSSCLSVGLRPGLGLGGSTHFLEVRMLQDMRHWLLLARWEQVWGNR